MCLGGGGGAAPTWQPPTPRVIPPGPESPEDKVNNQEVTNINTRADQAAKRNANRGAQATGQSKTIRDKAY